MRYLSIPEVLEIHDLIISSTGGSRGIRDLSALESAVNQPRQTFDQKDLYPDIVAKAAALCFSLVMNHPFVDGNKRKGILPFNSPPPNLPRQRGRNLASLPWREGLRAGDKK